MQWNQAKEGVMKGQARDETCPAYKFRIRCMWRGGKMDSGVRGDPLKCDLRSRQPK